MSDFTFEKAQHIELPKIVAIYNEAIPGRMATADLSPVSVEDREEWMQSFTKTHPLWVIKNDQDEVVGWVGLEPFYGRPAYEHTAEIAIYIDQKVQHQGLGKKAVQFVIDQLPSLGITAIVAYIFGHNAPSQKLFKSFGFKQWGHLPQVAILDGQKRDLDILGRRFD